MIPTPAEILRQINAGELLSAVTCSKMDHDAILDARDGDATFEAAWLQCERLIQQAWADGDVDESAAASAEDVRRGVLLGR